jgi:hypothetical protein
MALHTRYFIGKEQTWLSSKSVKFDLGKGQASAKARLSATLAGKIHTWLSVTSLKLQGWFVEHLSRT